LPFSSLRPRLSRVHAEIEKPKLELVAKRCFTIVVLPEPDGAEKNDKFAVFQCLKILGNKRLGIVIL
jgi:hypothetical protein